MKKNIILMFAAAILFTSCGTYAGSYAADGAYFGSILGSAIGGISGGHRGSDIGTLVGMAGGAIIGAAVGEAQEKAAEQDRYLYLEEKARLHARRDNQKAQYYDDRIDIDFGPGEPSYYQPAAPAQLEIRKLRFIDGDNDGVISRGETCEIVFEIFNKGKNTAFNIEPVVTETTHNKHILVSPTIRVESLAPHKGVRYTARVVANRTLKNGSVQFAVSVRENGSAVGTPRTINVRTHK